MYNEGAYLTVVWDWCGGWLIEEIMRLSWPSEWNNEKSQNPCAMKELTWMLYGIDVVVDWLKMEIFTRAGNVDLQVIPNIMESLR